MIAYSIECAVRSNLFNRVIVSTDDDEIADVARACGAEVPFRRPQELSDDHTGTAAVVAHAVEWLQKNGSDVTAACCIYATAPFIRESDLAVALAVLESRDWQYVFSATTFGFPIFRSFRLTSDASVQMFYPEHFNTRSQDLPEAMHDAGQFYWGRARAWLDHVRIFDKQSTVVTIPSWRVQDIDTLDDWERAEVILQVLQRAKPPA